MRFKRAEGAYLPSLPMSSVQMSAPPLVLCIPYLHVEGQQALVGVISLHECLQEAFSPYSLPPCVLTVLNAAVCAAAAG